MATGSNPYGDLRIPAAETAPLASGAHFAEDVFDRDEVLRRLNGNEALLMRLLRIFNDNALAELNLIREALDRSDPDASGRHAHALKGSAANVGAVRVQELARNMEQTAQVGDIVLLSSLVARTELELERFSKVMSE